MSSIIYQLHMRIEEYQCFFFFNLTLLLLLPLYRYIVMGILWNRYRQKGCIKSNQRIYIYDDIKVTQG